MKRRRIALINTICGVIDKVITKRIQDFVKRTK